MIYWIAGYIVGAIVTFAVVAVWSRRVQEAPGMAWIYAATWPLFLVILGYFKAYEGLAWCSDYLGFQRTSLDRAVWFCLGAGSSGVIALLVD